MLCYRYHRPVDFLFPNVPWNTCTRFIAVLYSLSDLREGLSKSERLYALKLTRPFKMLSTMITFKRLLIAMNDLMQFEKDDNGNSLSRLGQEVKISTLEFLWMASLSPPSLSQPWSSRRYGEKYRTVAQASNFMRHY